MDATEAWAKTVGTDLSLLGEGELCALAGAAAATRSAVQTAEALVLAELERRGTTGREQGLCTAKWHATRTGTPCREATAAIRVGGQLAGRFGQVRDALADGDITYAHARTIAESADEHTVEGLVAQQDRIIAEATAARSFRGWVKDLHARADRLRAESGHDPQKDPASNQARFCRRSQGLRGLEATFTDLLGLPVEQLLEAETDRRYRDAVTAHKLDPETPVPSRDQLRGEALAALVRRGAGLDMASSQKPQAEVILIIHADDPDLDHVETPDGTHVHPDAAATLACDAVLHPLLVNPRGDPLRMGRSIRRPNPEQRRALIARDGGCVMPGCDAPPAWCDGHHVIHWDPKGAGGPTDIDNLAFLCRSCHGKIHSKRFTLTADGHGRFTVTYPDGHTQPTQHRKRRPAQHAA